MLVITVFAGFLFGLISGGINGSEAVWGASDCWPTLEMQARCVHFSDPLVVCQTISDL